MNALITDPFNKRLYLLEAPVKRARESTCATVRGFLGRAYRRRYCLLPRMYHIQSPHHALLMEGLRHRAGGAQNGQPRHCLLGREFLRRCMALGRRPATYAAAYTDAAPRDWRIG
jgi:hypothetical protein